MGHFVRSRSRILAETSRVSFKSFEDSLLPGSKIVSLIAAKMLGDASASMFVNDDSTASRAKSQE